MQTTLRFRTRRGTSLIELLVVIVVFLVGILAVVQVFPKGLSILRQTRNASVATQLARSELERLKSLGDQIPDAIVANNDTAAAATFFGQIDVNATLNDWVPSDATALQQNGTLVSSFANGDWKEYTGANRFRGIIGEGRVIPAPRFIPQGASASLFGSLMILNFGPVRPSANPAIDTVQVYGNDLIVRGTDSGAPRRFRDYFAYYDDSTGDLYLPEGPYRVPQVARAFRVSITAYVDNAGTTEARSVVLRVNNVLSATSPRRGYAVVNLSALVPSLVGADWDSLRIQRLFQPVATFTDASANPSLIDDAVYEFIPLDYRLGQLLFNPSGFEYKELRGRGRLPMVARVDYNVLDWRIIRDDFRVPSNRPYLNKLLLSNLKVLKNQDVDGNPFPGLPVGPGGPNARDFVLIDMETGGLYDPGSYVVDKSEGLIRFVDLDNNPNNGIAADIVFPGQATTTRVGDISGRPVRALYMARGEWAVQPVKGATVYNSAWRPSITWDQCFPGLADGASGRAYNIYFPLSDIGKRVTIGEIWYNDPGNPGVPQVLRDQEFMIQAPETGDLRLARVDIRPATNPAATLNFSNGYAVRRARGTSVSVRVFYNPQYLKLGVDDQANLRELNTWIQGLRHNDTETFLAKGASEQ